MKKNKMYFTLNGRLINRWQRSLTIFAVFLLFQFVQPVMANSVNERNRLQSFSEQKNNPVSGVVNDSSGLPIPGVSVVVKGTTVGTITDANGNYNLDFPEGSKILLFSFVGMNQTEVVVGNQSVINVTMSENTIGIDEVVAIGYGVQKKRDVSTAISSVSSDDLKDRPVTNFAQAIAGKMAGVSITTTNAAPGGASKINIRGVGSINASTSPLFVIDGFPLKDESDGNKNENPLNSINTSDIESIEVLKDASSSAIYGTRAANGVILITTKRGKSGKPKVSVNVSSGVQQMVNKMEPLKRDDFLQFLDDSRAMSYIQEDPNYGTNDPNAPLWKWTDSPELRISNWANFSQHKKAMAVAGGSLHYRWITVSDTVKNSLYDTNWQDEMTRLGKVNDIQLSVNGGSENVSYMISGGYFDQEGIVPSSGFNRFSFRANIDAKINDWLKVGLNLAPSLENTKVLGDIDAGIYVNPFLNAVAMLPIWAPYDQNGAPAYYGQTAGGPWDWNFTTVVNPLSGFEKKDHRRTAKNLSTIFSEIKLFKDLTFRSEFHNEFRFYDRETYTPSTIPTRSLTYSRSNGLLSSNTRINWNFQNFLTYHKSVQKHLFTAMLGYSAEETTYKSSFIQKSDFSTDQISTLNQATTVVDQLTDARTNQSSESIIGSFARLIYNYNSRYYLTASVRRDGSSKFGKDNKWGVFPSVSLAWRVSDEAFFESFTKYVSDWKIRGGAGKIGNSGIGNYSAIPTLTGSTYVFGASSNVTPTYVTGKVDNPTLGWETTIDYNIGTDLQFLNNRVGASVDYFYRLTTDMLFNLPLPTISGFSSFLSNTGSMRNRGFEFVVNTKNFVGDFNWNTDFNLYYSRNRVVDMGGLGNIINNNCYTVEGKPLAGIWGMVDLGAYKDWEDVKTSPIFGANQPLWRQRSGPGFPKAADVNGDGILDASDQTIVGSSFPDFTWGMTNTFEYKGIDLSIQVNGTQGGDISMNGYEDLFARPTGMMNTTADYYNNYWRPDRTDAIYPSPVRKSYEGSNTAGTLTYKGTFVNIQNVSLGYTLPKHLLNSLQVNNARFYINIQNALMITKFPGFNPEGNSEGSSSLSQGIDRGSYPLARTVSFGVNLTL